MKRAKISDVIWFRSAEKSWVRGTILRCENAVLTVKQDGGAEVTVDPCVKEAHPANDSCDDGTWKDLEFDDMCSMMHINEPSILQNLKVRAAKHY